MKACQKYLKLWVVQKGNLNNFSSMIKVLIEIMLVRSIHLAL